MQKTRFLLLLFLLICTFFSISIAQERYVSVGATIGLGQIKGRSPMITSLAGQIFTELQPGFWEDLSFRFSFIYAQKFEKFLPGDQTGKYYPFIKSFQVFGVLRQSVNEKIFIKEGFGFTVINDRTFSDVNELAYGIAFFASPGIDLRSGTSTGFTLAANLNFGLAFTGNTPLYYLFLIGTEYYF